MLRPLTSHLQSIHIFKAIKSRSFCIAGTLEKNKTGTFLLIFASKTAHFLSFIGVLLGMPRWNGWVGQWWPLGPHKKKLMFLFGLGWHACSNAQKCNEKIAMGLRLGFLKIFFQNPEVVSLVAASTCHFHMSLQHASTCQKVTKATRIGLFGYKKQH